MLKLIVLAAVCGLALAKPGHAHGDAGHVAAPGLAYGAPAVPSPAVAYSAPAVAAQAVDHAHHAVPAAISHQARVDVVHKPQVVTYATHQPVIPAHGGVISAYSAPHHHPASLVPAFGPVQQAPFFTAYQAPQPVAGYPGFDGHHGAVLAGYGGQHAPVIAAYSGAPQGHVVSAFGGAPFGYGGFGGYDYGGPLGYDGNVGYGHYGYAGHVGQGW